MVDLPTLVTFASDMLDILSSLYGYMLEVYSASETLSLL